MKINKKMNESLYNGATISTKMMQMLSILFFG
jgi:hypothetical protein